MKRELGVERTDIFVDFKSTLALAEAGDPSAQVKIGDIYCTRALGEFRYRQKITSAEEYVKPDDAVAFSWYERAESKAYYEAYERYAECYLFGYCGFEVDREKGFMCLSDALNNGGVWACLRFGELLLQGGLFGRDPQTANNCFYLASRLDDPDALMLYGDGYFNGDGVDVNVDKALESYLRALQYAKFCKQKLYLRIGDCYARKGDLKTAREYYEKV